jgi:uncharacterized protein
MLLCDTGVLLAAGNVKDHHHAACLALMRAAEGPLLVPSPVLGEIGYLLQSRVGPHAEVTFLKSFGGNGFHVAEVEEGDISRIAELVEQYVSLPLGIVDAAVIAIAERLNLTEVATVDRKHFSIVRQGMSPRSGSSPKHPESTHALRRLRTTARTLPPNRPTDNDDRPSLAMKGTIGPARTAQNPD